MYNIIEEFYYGNIEPQELTTEITPKLKKKLSALVKKEEELTAMLPEKERELFVNYVNAHNEFFKHRQFRQLHIRIPARSKIYLSYIYN